MVDEIQRQRAFTRPTTGRTLANAIGRTGGGSPMPGGTGRSMGPAGGPTTFRNTYPLSAQRVDDYMTRGMGPRGFNRQQVGRPANIGFDRMGIGSLQDQAAVDPSDWRTILKILESGGDPQTETAGIMGALPQERQVAELGLPQPMDWQNERLSLDELINLGASEDQIAQYLGVA